MTSQVKNRVLKYLNNQKLFGFQYHKELNINLHSSCDFNLPNSLNELEKSVKNCYLCDLSKSRKNVLFGYGNISSKIVFIYDMPTKSEDEVGSFYFGNSSELLAKMIENVLNIKKEDVYTTTLVKCRTNGELSFANCESCECYLFKQIDIIKPKLIVAVGDSVYSYLMKDKDNFFKNRGKVFNYNSSLLIPIYSPMYILKNPSVKKDSYLDMLKIKEIYEGELN